MLAKRSEILFFLKTAAILYWIIIVITSLKTTDATSTGE
jgi:hypothetical protein